MYQERMAEDRNAGWRAQQQAIEDWRRKNIAPMATPVQGVGEYNPESQSSINDMLAKYGYDPYDPSDFVFYKSPGGPNTRPAPSQKKNISPAKQALDAIKGQAISMGINYGATQAGEEAGFTSREVGGALGTAKGAYDAYKILSSDMTKEQKAKALERKGQDVAAGMATGGISTGVQLVDNKLFGGQIEKGRDKADKAMASKAGQVILPMNALSSKAMEKAVGLFSSGPSTKEIQADRRSALLKSGVTGYEDFLKNTEGTVSDKGFEASRDESLMTPEQVWGGTGMFETFGNDWLGKYGEEDRRAISQGLIDQGLIDEKKGGIYIKDQEAARKLAAELVPTPGATEVSKGRESTPFAGKIPQKATSQKQTTRTQSPRDDISTSLMYEALQPKPSQQEQKARLTPTEYGEALLNIYEQNSRVRG